MLCKTSLRLVVLTLVTVSARNLYRDNIRDVYLPQTKLDFDTPYESDGRRADHFSGEEFHSAVSKDLSNFGEQRRFGSEINHHDAHRTSNAQGNERHHNFQSVNRQSNHRNVERDLEGKELNSEIERESHSYGLENFGQTNINHRSIESHITGRHQNSNQNFYGSDTHEYGSSSFGQSQGRDRIDSSVHQTDLQGSGVRRNRPESFNNDDQFYSNREQQNLRDLDRQIKENERRRDEVSGANQEIFQNNRYRGQSTQRVENIRHIVGSHNQNTDRRVDVDDFPYNQQSNQNNGQPVLNQRINDDTRNRQSERDFVPQNHNVARHKDSSNNNQKTIHEDRRGTPTNNNRETENGNPRVTNQQNTGYGNDENIPHSRQRHENVQGRVQPQDNTRNINDQTIVRVDPSTNDQNRQDNDHRNRNQQNNGNTNQNTRTEIQNGQTNRDRPYQGTDSRDHINPGKSSSDNEVVTPNSSSNSNDSRSEGRESPEDKWVWGIENGKKPEPSTTTPQTVTLDDRAAFNGDKCPTGKTKIGDKCVDVD